LERWESGQASVEELLEQHPAQRAELEHLLQVAAELRGLSAVRAPERLRRDPLWRRGRDTPAEAPGLPEPISLPRFAAQRASAAGARLEPHDVLAECLEHWERGEPGADELLKQHPDVEPLVQLAVDLWSMPPVQAPARLRQDPLWRRAAIPAAASTEPAATDEPASLPLWAAARHDSVAPAARLAAGSRLTRPRLVRTLSRLAAGVGGAGLALLLAGSLATSTATSLPDEPLYPVKRLVEDAQLAVAPPQARLEIRMQRAQERMKETREMVERDRADVVASLAADYVREVDAVRTELQSPQSQTPAPEQVGRVVTRLEANEQMLGAIVDRVPEQARPAVARAVEVSRPESVTPDARPVSSAPAAIAAPADAASDAPAAVAAPAAAESQGPRRVAPAVAPIFGERGPASISLPSARSRSPEGGSGSAPASNPGRVSIPEGAGAAPAILPSASSAGGLQPAPASTTGGAGAAGSAGSIPSLSAGAAPASSPASLAPPSATGGSSAGATSAGTASSITGGSASSASGSAGATAGSLGGSTGSAGGTAGNTTGSAGSASGAANSASSGSGSAPANGASGSAPASVSGAAGASGGTTTAPRTAPSFDAPSQPAPAPAATSPSASPTPVYQILPPAGGSTAPTSPFSRTAP
jgi:hypothetical protein